MKKILSILATVGLTSTAATSVVACGNKSSSQVGQKTSLGSLETLNKTVKGLPGMTTWIEALDDFLKDDANKTLKDEVEVKNADVDWIAPQLGVDGSLTITAKPNSSYIGSTTITVTGYTMALESFTDLRPEIDGSAVMTSDQALKTFLKSPYNAFLANEVIVKEDSLVAPTPEKAGKFIIQPNLNSKKYTGTIDVSISYSIAKDATIVADHKSATLSLTSEEALLLDLVKKNDDGTYGDGAKWQATFTSTNLATITASLVHGDDGSVVITLTTNQLMVAPRDVAFEIGNYKLIVNQLNLDFQKITKTAVVDASRQKATLNLSSDDTLNLGLVVMGDSGNYQFGKNYPFLTNGVLPITTLGDDIVVRASIVGPSEDGTSSIRLTSDKPIPANSVIVFGFGDYTLTININ